MPEDDLTFEPPDDVPGNPEFDPVEPQGAAPAEGDAAAAPAKANSLGMSPDQIAALGSSIGKALHASLQPPSQPADPTAPAVPLGPTPAELQGKIDELDSQIDMAVQEARPIRELTKARDSLRDQKFDIERVQPLRLQGAQAVNNLNIAELRRNDRYFVKYEKEIMALLAPAMQQGQVVTGEILRNATDYIKGKHSEEIMAEVHEAAIRGQKLGYQAPMPGSMNGRSRANQPRTPATIRERFGQAADEAFSTKRTKGYTEDSYAQKLGYRNKAEWFAADDEASRSNGHVPLDSIWDKKNKRWVSPDEANEFYGG